MAGFANRKYRPTVSRLIPSSFAMRRWDHPRSAKLYIVVCKLTLRTLDTLHWNCFPIVPWSCFSFLKVAGFDALNSDPHWLVLTDRLHFSESSTTGATHENQISLYLRCRFLRTRR